MLLDQGDPGSNYGGVRFLLAHYGGPLIPSEEKRVWFFLTRVPPKFSKKPPKLIVLDLFPFINDI